MSTLHLDFRSGLNAGVFEFDAVITIARIIGPAIAILSHILL